MHLANPNPWCCNCQPTPRLRVFVVIPVLSLCTIVLVHLPSPCALNSCRGQWAHVLTHSPSGNIQLCRSQALELRLHTQASSLYGNTRAIYVYYSACTSALTMRPQLMQGTVGACFYPFSVWEYPVVSIPGDGIESAHPGFEFVW